MAHRPLTLMMITNDADIAAFAVRSGVNRIFVDLETLGKDERQGALDTHRACHSPADVADVRRRLPDASLMARVNPLHDGTRDEVDAVIDAGASHVMLPMFTHPDEVEAFLDHVGGRANSTLLLETPQAMARIDEVLDQHARIDEIHVGLNDLHLGMRLDFMFELVAGGLLGYLADKIRRRGIRFGFGGIARVGDGEVPAEMVLGEHVRLRSEMVILSRAFHGGARTLEELRHKLDLPAEIQRIRAWEARHVASDEADLEANRRALRQRICAVARRRRSAVAAAPAAA